MVKPADRGSPVFPAICSAFGTDAVRELGPGDAEMVCEVVRGNELFYRFHPPQPSPASILRDMTLLPPGANSGDKHYIGFFAGEKLTAVMDLVENWPQPGTVMIGFFAVRTELQGCGIGTGIISGCAGALRKAGFRKIRLAVDEGNPQSRAFWIRNSFAFAAEPQPDRVSPYQVMERIL